ncbi:MAG TPA: response regulator transcription factor [Candidatus Polarisedimenticolaceae bacterium]|nr:response regulator transcription factor [Candidatus Polarisedimenticolaceae bacterium]
MSARIRVGIVEDQPEIREGLAQLAAEADGFELVGAWGSMEQALPQLTRIACDVVLVDLGLPGMDGTEGIRRLKQRRPELVALVLSVYDDDERIFQALCAGAGGYLLKKTPPDRLLEAVRDAVGGGAPVSPEIARRVIALFRRFRPPERADYDLTPHETRLLRLLVEGHNYRSAAALLGCSVHTVNFHVRSIYRKLEVHSKSEAVAKALREGMAS